MKIGIIARCNNRGLGIQSWEMCNHIKPDKVLVVKFHQEDNFPERFKNATITEPNIQTETIQEFLQGLDIVLSFETFYTNDILRQAKRMGVKTVLQPNYEWFPHPKEGDLIPDLYIPPSVWNYSLFPKNKEYMPVPINRDKLKFKLRTKAKVFYHNAGNGNASWDRDGTGSLLKAIPLVKTKDIKFVIHSQVKLKDAPKDKRIEYRIKDYKNYWEGIDGDVLIYPRKYAGLSLKLNEAMSRGLVPLMIDIPPVNHFLPKKLLIKSSGRENVFVKNDFTVYDVDPKDIANKIDEIANTNITSYSKISDHIASEWSWEKMLPKYMSLFTKLCQQEK